VSIKKNPLPTKNQTLRSYQSINFAYIVGITSFYSNRIIKNFVS